MCLGTFLYKTVLLTPTRYHTIILSIDSCVVFAYFAGGIGSGTMSDRTCFILVYTLFLLYNTFFYRIRDRKIKEESLFIWRFLFFKGNLPFILLRGKTTLCKKLRCGAGWKIFLRICGTQDDKVFRRNAWHVEDISLCSGRKIYIGFHQVGGDFQHR